MRISPRSLIPAILALALSSALIALTADAAPPSILTIGAGPAGRSIPPGFLGLSTELPGFTAYAGDNPAAPNPIMIQLIQNLTPGQRPVIRLGGDSTDWTWWPIPGLRQPLGIRYTLNRQWIAIARAVTQALNARLILGINLEADNTRVASGEAKALLSGIGQNYVQALELGNEPELYTAFPWYKTATGQSVFGRPPKNWTYAAFARDYAAIVRALPQAPLAAPSIGAPQWQPNLGSFLRSQPRTAIATLHRYPLKHCTASTRLTVDDLLSTASSAGLANEVAGYAATAHSHHIPLRIDEMNSVSCGGQHGLSDTYASALWAVDALYEMARVGVDGVNIHTAPNGINQVFLFHHLSGGWIGSVRPLYYGLLMFAQAAPPGSRILRVAGQTPGPVRVWATRGTDGTVRVVLINDGSRPHTISFRTPGTANIAASVARLEAPSITAQSGITLAGRTFGVHTRTGLLDGPLATPTLTPHNGVYTVSLPAASAALVTARP